MATKTPTPSPKSIPDVQASGDERRIAIDKVGVKHITYPITVRCPATGGVQHTVAQVNMYVSLPHHQKGTHMSRFLEVLNRHHGEIRSDQVMDICHDVKKSLKAQQAHLELRFPYFIHKKAPVSGSPGMLDIQVTFECTSDGEDDFIMGVRVPATSLCPCSKEIAMYGAHNQRCEIEARVRFAPGKFMWIEELFETVEGSASSPVYAVLKRTDEKHVTEAAYDNPKFVEDIVRDLAIALEAEDRVVWYQINSENFESIHNHNAYAMIEKPQRARVMAGRRRLELVLYSRDGCGLCDRLEGLILPCLEGIKGRADVWLSRRDITDDLRWLEMYRDRIPVLTCNEQIVLEGRPEPGAVWAAIAGLVD